ncbi:MAG: HAMP domain-containing protein [Rhodobacteraceae bacterium]|nr:HAMP domain-containing protein [Paracoccaceae bacterium]
MSQGPSADKRRFSWLSKPGLATQFMGLLLLAIIVAQAVSFMMFFDERRITLRDMARENILRRVVSMVRLIDETPEVYHRRILNASRSQLARIWINEEPLLDEPGKTVIARRLQDTLASEFQDNRSIRVRLRTGDRQDGDMPRPPPRESREGQDDDEDERPRDRRRFDREGDLSISIQLNDGRWFNTRTLFLPPTKTLIPLLSQMAVTMLAVILIVAFLVRRISKPLKDLSVAAAKLGRGEHLETLEERGPREVKDLTRAFNDMQTRLTRFVSDRTRMLAAISHDLRTPITSLRLRAEFIDDDENREKIIATLDEMAQMTAATLAFARDEAQKEPTVQTDLTSLLHSIVDDQSDMGRPVSMAEDIPKQVVSIRPLAMKRALINLIENGVRYGEAVTVSMAKESQDIVIRVRDKGPGVPEDRLKDIFEPFVRLEDSRSEETGGIGLGLSITRSIIHAHGGMIQLQNHPDGGLEAVVTLPL